ncbi:MAG: lipoprotein [Magnetococcales bacterium]|nr:lipoprotein [Magnetococcales bacterium]NGZ07181.1 lipoprotein [Magnetococcales bacterium]
MQPTRSFILLAVITTLGLSLTSAGCGHKGELYLPGKQEQNNVTAPRPSS